jgi:hypothetical protein
MLLNQPFIVVVVTVVNVEIIYFTNVGSLAIDVAKKLLAFAFAVNFVKRSSNQV